MADKTLKVKPVRLSYASIFTQKKNKKGEDAGWGATILLPKTDTATKALIDAAVEAAIQDGIGKPKVFGGQRPNPGPGFKMPLRDGDVEKPGDENYKGMWFFSANNKKKSPNCYVRKNGITVDATSEEEIYSGCWGAAVLSFFPFNNEGNKGVAVSFEGFAKLKDGDRLSGSAGASADDFEGDFATDFDNANDDVL